jgi:hypothetical protein
VGNQFDCVDGLSCANLFQGALACYQMCMGNGGPPLDGGFPFDGGFAGDAVSAVQCGQCGVQSYQGDLVGCFQSTTCMPWGQCALGCFQGNQAPGCFAACDAQHRNAKANYDTIYSCLCASGSMQCASTDPCVHGMDGGP